MKSTKILYFHILCMLSRDLVKMPGFELTPRDRSCLPKELPSSISGTCYFLTGYKHSSLPEDAGLQQHINAALKELGISS